MVGGRREVGKRGCEGRQSDPSGHDKAEWKTDECGERGGSGGMERGSTWREYAVCCSLSAPPPPHTHTIAPSLHFCLPKST